MSEKNEKKSFMCQECGQGFSDLAVLRGHEKTHDFNDFKKEVLDNVSVEKKKKKQWDSIFVTIILVILVSVSVVQAYESRNILKKVQSGKFKSTGGSGTAAPLPASIQDLPDMVGGC